MRMSMVDHSHEDGEWLEWRSRGARSPGYPVPLGLTPLSFNCQFTTTPTQPGSTSLKFNIPSHYGISLPLS